MESTIYEGGLRFECTRCNRCCRHETGYVFMSERDIERLCRGLSLGREAFVGRYCRNVQLGPTSWLSLLETDDFDCIFWKDGGCSVYEHRPLQCRSYPFWQANLESDETWQDTATQCEGVGRGRVHSKKEIDAWLLARRAETPV